MRRDFRRGAAFSAGLHLAVVLAFLIAIPSSPPDVPEETEISMVFGQAPQAAKGKSPAPVAAPAPLPVPVEAPQAEKPPTDQPNEPPPPPPPATTPPPPPQSAPAPPLPTPPIPAPPPTPSPAPPVPTPPPPAAPPTPPAPPLPTPPLPTPPVPTPPPEKASPLPQPNQSKNAAPESTALENTLEKLRALQKQTQAPTRRYNPAQGGAPNGGGNPTGDDTSKLSSSDARAIGDSVQRCWTFDAGAKDVNKLQVLLTVKTDEAGVARDAAVAEADQGRLSDPVFRAFAERAVRAVRSPQCATLPVPRSMQGQRQTFTFRFRPGE